MPVVYPVPQQGGQLAVCHRAAQPTVRQTTMLASNGLTAASITIQTHTKRPPRRPPKRPPHAHVCEPAFGIGSPTPAPPPNQVSGIHGTGMGLTLTLTPTLNQVSGIHGTGMGDLMDEVTKPFANPNPNPNSNPNPKTQP